MLVIIYGRLYVFRISNVKRVRRVSRKNTPSEGIQRRSSYVPNLPRFLPGIWTRRDCHWWRRPYWRPRRYCSQAKTIEQAPFLIRVEECSLSGVRMCTICVHG